MKRQRAIVVFLVLALTATVIVPELSLVNKYIELIIMYIGINMILALSLNLINGYMGEFSVGHAGFMAIGAYASSIFTMHMFQGLTLKLMFPVAIMVGGVASALAGLLISIPSFKTRGDYLAIVTLAFSMIVKSVIENVDAIGGPRGLPGIDRLTTPPWVFLWVVVTFLATRNFVYSSYGRGVMSIREDEIAGILSGIDTRKVKVAAFVISSFFAGVAGGLYAHLLQFINPRMFDIIKSTEILVMVYLGGIGSIMGSFIGATIYTILLEVLRPAGVWRMVLMPILLVLLMIWRPHGIMGLRELRCFIPQFKNENNHE